MNTFDRYTRSDPSAQESIERDEQHARAAERRLEALDARWEYGDCDCGHAHDEHRRIYVYGLETLQCDVYGCRCGEYSGPSKAVDRETGCTPEEMEDAA